MKTVSKTQVLSGIVSGIVYAELMAGFDYSDGQQINVKKFVLNTLFFGLFMVVLNLYNLKKNREKNNRF